MLVISYWGRLSLLKTQILKDSMTLPLLIPLAPILDLSRSAENIKSGWVKGNPSRVFHLNDRLPHFSP